MNRVMNLLENIAWILILSTAFLFLGPLLILAIAIELGGVWPWIALGVMAGLYFIGWASEVGYWKGWKDQESDDL